MKFYDKKNKRLVELSQKADRNFWDAHWRSGNLEKEIKKYNSFIVDKTRKYLPEGSRILEGGCGQGSNVYSLQRSNYNVYGIDYAEKTVEKINESAPELNVSLGNVKNLEFENNFFDGYWSLGVIEHFYEGFADIISEMHRTLRPGGFLFLTVPTISLLRRLKILLNLYPEWRNENFDQGCFYQFIFWDKKLIEEIQNAGFQLIEIQKLGGMKGLKDECSPFKPILQYIYDSKFPLFKAASLAIDKLSSFFASHMTLFVFKKI